MNKKELAKILLELLLATCIILFLISAISTIFAMSGNVYGTEFGLLIKLVSASNKMLVLLCLYILQRALFPEARIFSGIIDFLKTVQINIGTKKS